MLTRFFTSISNVLDINVATMSGCNDIIVIPHPDGSLKSTPFHVRFGKSKVLRSRQTKVSITVNRRSTNVYMYLDASGGAYFHVAPKALKRLNSSFDLNPNSFTFPLHKSSNEAREVMHYPSKFSNDIEQPYSQNGYLCSNGDLKSIKSSHTLRPTSDQLRSFHLQPGYNLVEFSVQSYFQGNQTVRGSIYLWKPTVKIIVSDIDGTITKSDVIGQLSPILKKDWSHIGVAALFSALKKNNYKILYLSSRSIGQTDVTRDYLFGLRQGKSCEVLPDGPIILNPNRLVSSFLVEVVKRQAYVFKTSVLKDLKSLFPFSFQPFYAGFGNRVTDMISYKAIGIPESRRYIVDTKGVVHNSSKGTESNTYATLYKSLDIAFPPVQLDSSDEVIEQLVLSNKRINKNVFYGFTQSRVTKTHSNISRMNSMNKSPFFSCSRFQRMNSFC